MIFLDEVEIFVRGGRGGDGAVSFRREKYVEKGGPDGGDGGRGGSVIMKAVDDLNTLIDFTGRRHWHAHAGRPGAGANCSGKSAPDLIVRVPVGTVIYDRQTGSVLKDLVEPGATVCVGRGGKGGHGNAAFATSTHQTPREFERGEEGEERWLRLELKLIADAGIVGMPNAGKSTLLSRLSRARPKIADYPFTTLAPQLGIVELRGFRRIVLADIPGLIEGASDGAGLGDQFLRHIERTRVLVHLVDLFPLPGQPDPAEAYRIVRAELAKYSPALAAKPELIVANKLDLALSTEEFDRFRAAVGGSCIGISGVTGQGLPDLVESVWRMIEEKKAAEASQAATAS